MIQLLLITFVIVALMMGFMGVGLLFRGRCFFGSCGSANDAVIGPDGVPIRCSVCPHKDDPDHECDEMHGEDAVLAVKNQ